MVGSDKFIVIISECPETTPSIQVTPFNEKRKFRFVLLVAFLFDLIMVFLIYYVYFRNTSDSENSTSGGYLIRGTGDYKESTASMYAHDYLMHSTTAKSNTVKMNGEFEDSKNLESPVTTQTDEYGADEMALLTNSSVSSEDASTVSDESALSTSYGTSLESELPQLSECGRRIIENENFTEGPEANTYFGQYPWMLTLLYYNSRGAQTYKCGASLIAPDIALTAAHCVQYDVDYLVRSGEWYLGGNHDQEYLPVETRTVTHVQIHPLYNRDTLSNDIALVKLDSRIEYKDHIQPVCLHDWFIKIDPNNCALTGWGRNSRVDTRNNKFLRRIGLSLVGRESCEVALHRTRLGQYYELPYGNMCAWNASSPVNSCKGDGGSPLVCPTLGHPTRYVQVGIAVWSVDCVSSVPDVYINVEAYREWIDETVTEWGKNHTEPVT